MRKLVLVPADHFVRQFLESGALDGLEDGDLYFVASSRNVVHESSEAALREQPGYFGRVDDPRKSIQRPFSFLRRMLLSALRRRSFTMRAKEAELPPAERRRYRIAALPGLRQWHIRRAFRRAGLNPDLDRIVRELDPDLIIALTGGYDTLVWEGLAVARAHRVPTLALVHNWDNLSSKGAFPIKPDYLGVWGEQSVEHACRIHGFDRERVTALGSPSLDLWFRHRPGSTESRFPFRYALFAGCFAPFDERAALERLDRLIEAAGLDLKVVYRPHPHRRPRRTPDRVDESTLHHVVIDPELRETYLATFENEYAEGAKRPRPLFPPLESYPSLFEHAEFVICPLSTMIVEAAIFERRVIVVAYKDGVHPNSPAVVVHYDHFEGIDRIEGFDLARSEAELERLFLRLASARPQSARSLREQLGWWIHSDERTYSERLADLVRRIAADPGAERARAAGDPEGIPVGAVR